MNIHAFIILCIFTNYSVLKINSDLVDLVNLKNKTFSVKPCKYSK